MAIGESLSFRPLAIREPGLLFPQNDDPGRIRERIERALIYNVEFVQSRVVFHFLVEKRQSLIETGWKLAVVLPGPNMKGKQPALARIEFCKGLFVPIFPFFQRSFRFRYRPLRPLCCCPQDCEFVRLLSQGGHFSTEPSQLVRIVRGALARGGGYSSEVGPGREQAVEKI